MWEMLHPAEALEDDSRLAVADDVVRFWHDLLPEYEAMHSNSGAAPNECLFITQHEFLSDQWGGPHHVPSYEQHLALADQRGAYAFHRRVLQTLERRRRGERWLLKAPSHLFHLEALFAVYPEARIVHTHRDPLKTLPSTLSLMGALQWMRGERVDMARKAKLLPRGLATAYRREIEARASGALPDERFFDVRYADLMADPLGTLEALYARLGWDLVPSARAAMQALLARQPRGARGAHRYTLAEFGLDAAVCPRRPERLRYSSSTSVQLASGS
jgi:hypothetical protein